MDADVVCLQETNKKWENIIRKGLIKKYPHIYFKHLGMAGGMAILSKYPIVKSEVLKNQPGWFPAWVITVKKDGEYIQLLNVHLKPGLTEKGRLGWNAYFKAEDVHHKELAQFIDQIDPGIATVILGDFNENDKGKTMKWLREEKNFQDALPQFDKHTKTWRWILLRGRYDHLVSNDKLSCSDAKVFKLGKSDHFPIMGAFELK